LNKVIESKNVFLTQKLPGIFSELKTMKNSQNDLKKVQWENIEQSQDFLNKFQKLFLNSSALN
jgi:hypothetical protein